MKAVRVSEGLSSCWFTADARVMFTRLRDRGWYRALFNTSSFRERFHYTVICIRCNVKDRAALLLASGYSWLDLNLVFRSTATSPPPSYSSPGFTVAQWFTWQWNVPGYECVYNYNIYRLKYQLAIKVHNQNGFLSTLRSTDSSLACLSRHTLASNYASYSRITTCTLLICKLHLQTLGHTP